MSGQNRNRLLNRLTRLPRWLREVLTLGSPEVPSLLLLESITPVVNIMDVASRGVGGTATSIAVVQLPDIPGGAFLIQADPANVDDVLLGFAPGVLPLVLAAGQSVEATVANLNFFFFSSAGAGAVTVNFFALQPV